MPKLTLTPQLHHRSVKIRPDSTFYQPDGPLATRSGSGGERWREKRLTVAGCHLKRSRDGAIIVDARICHSSPPRHTFPLAVAHFFLFTSRFPRYFLTTCPSQIFRPSHHLFACGVVPNVGTMQDETWLPPARPIRSRCTSSYLIALLPRERAAEVSVGHGSETFGRAIYVIRSNLWTDSRL